MMKSSEPGEILRIQKIAGKIITSLPLLFSTENPYSEFFGQNIFNYQSFYDKLSAPLCKENTLTKFIKMENICKIPLSDTKNYTLGCYHGATKKFSGVIFHARHITYIFVYNEHEYGI